MQHETPEPRAAVATRTADSASKLRATKTEHGRDLWRILRIAGPVIASNLIGMALTVVDQVMIGRLGAAPLAAVGLSVALNGVFSSALIATKIAVQIQASRRIGEKNEGGAIRHLYEGLVLGGGLGLAVAVPAGLMLNQLLAGLMGDQQVRHLAYDYLTIILMSLPVWGASLAFSGYWTAKEKTHLIFMVNAIGILVNIVLDYILIFGAFGAPRLGVAGAAMATLAAHMTMLIASVWLFRRTLRTAQPTRLTFDAVELISTLRLLLPATGQMLIVEANLLALAWIVGLLGIVELAAGILVFVIASMGFALLVGFDTATTTLVSQALGARQLREAQTWFARCAILAFISVLLPVVPMMVAPTSVAGLVSSDPQVVAAARTPVMVVGLTLMLMAPSLILEGALRAAGAMAFVSRTMFVSQIVIGLPLTYLMAVTLDLGLTAVYWVQFAAWIVQLSLFTAYWITGKWKAERSFRT